MSKSLNNQPSASLIRAITKAAKPLVRLLMHFQITFPVFSQLLKQVYVAVADQEFGIDNKSPTDSRISLLTGIHRKDVRRLRHSHKDDHAVPHAVSIGTQMIGTWLADPNYLDASGQPMPLPRSLTKSSPAAANVSFETLVATVVKQDIRPKVVLDEWLRLGVVELTEGFIVLNTAAFIPQQGFDEKAFFFGKNLHDHIAAGAHNLLGGLPPQFDRAVFYNNLSKDDIAMLEKMVNERASALLVDVNQQARFLQKANQGRPEANQRFNLGAYFWVEEQAADESAEDGAEKSAAEAVDGEA